MFLSRAARALFLLTRYSRHSWSLCLITTWTNQMQKVKKLLIFCLHFLSIKKKVSKCHWKIKTIVLIKAWKCNLMTDYDRHTDQPTDQTSITRTGGSEGSNTSKKVIWLRTNFISQPDFFIFTFPNSFKFLISSDNTNSNYFF